MSISFSCTSYGKCILLGEHAVIRGSPALVFPLASRSLELQYTVSTADLTLHLQGDHGRDLQLLVWGVLDRACSLKGLKRNELKGELSLRSSIPVGAGMGASGALCVALTRWLGYLGHVQESEYYDFARTLEDLFHGESSGIDIAIALWAEGLRFVRGGQKTPIKLAWQPLWFISYTGKRGITVDAVNQVKALIANNPPLGAELDLRMKQSVELAYEALTVQTSDSFANLKKALELGGTCFEEWGLNDSAVKEHMQWLHKSGAIAMKPTGSGGGGYVVSLWDRKPDDFVLKDLISF